MLSDGTKSDSFSDFVVRDETKLRQALSSSFGPEIGREAAAEAVAYGWEHWDRIRDLENPAGYLFRVGQRAGRRMRPRKRTALPSVNTEVDPWVEPELPEALRRLPNQQRTVVALLYGYDWSMSEVAELMGVSKSTVQTYSERGLKRLRRSLGVEL